MFLSPFIALKHLKNRENVKILNKSTTKKLIGYNLKYYSNVTIHLNLR